MASWFGVKSSDYLPVYCDVVSLVPSVYCDVVSLVPSVYCDVVSLVPSVCCVDVLIVVLCSVVFVSWPLRIVRPFQNTVTVFSYISITRR